MPESATTTLNTVLSGASQNGSDSDRSPNQPARAKGMRSKRRRHLLIAVVSIALCIAFVYAWHYLSGFESTDDAQVDVHLYPVSARISGYIEKVNVSDNQHVHRGETLAEIDPADYQVAVNRAQADLDNAIAAARALRIDVPVTAVDTASQLQFSSSAIDNAKAGVTAAEKKAADRKSDV